MLRRLNSRLQARIEGRGVHLVYVRGRRAVHEVRAECGGPAPGLDDLIDALGHCLGELQAKHRLAGVRCDVVVADSWLAYDVLRGDLAEVPESAADEVVRASLADTLAVKPDELAVRWQPQREHGSVACALPRVAVDRLRSVLAAAKLRLGRVEGDFVHAFNARRTGLAASRAVLAVVRAEGTQFGLVVDRGLAAMRFEAGPRTADRLQGDVAGFVRCAGLGTEDDVRCVAEAAADAALPVGWAATDVPPPSGGRPPRLEMDLARLQPRVPPLRRAMLGAGIAAAIASGLYLQDAVDERDRALADQSELRAALGAVRHPHSPERTPAEARMAKAAAGVIRDLTVPWPALMATFEAAAGTSVALLAVEPTSQRDEVRFTGEAKSSSAMLDYLDALRGTTLTEVTLVSHQSQAQTPGVPIRFQARAIWTRPDRTAQANP